MEKSTSESDLHRNYQTMDESLEFIFQSMIREGDVLDALSFIRSIDISFLPSRTVMHTVIFEILMKHDDIKCLAFTSDYLMTVLNAFPPSCDERRLFYFNSIRSNKGSWTDIWTLFCHIVNSYFFHRKIYEIEKDGNGLDPMKYPNCKFLLEFYIRLFTMDVKHRNPRSSCLLMNMLWRDGSISLSSNRAENVLKWINDIYAMAFVNDVGDLLGSMHELLTLMVNCIIHEKHYLTDLAAFCNPTLTDIVEAIVNFCKNAFAKPSNLKLFLSSLSLEYLQAKVCEKIIKQIIKESSKKHFVMTLQDIVDQCMFPKKFNKFKNVKPNLNKEKHLRKRATEKVNVTEKKTSATDKKMKTTELHEICKKKKFGDLLQALMISKCSNINARDYSGSTPLHEACHVSSYQCVKILIEQSSKVSLPLDFGAANFEGQTPLHIAIKQNCIDIAKELLQSGGSELLTAVDKNGYHPSDYCASDEMDKLLKEYQPEANHSESDSTVVNEAPKLKSFKDYSIYLHALNCLLCSYCNIFNLFEVVWKKNTVVQSHRAKICCHYIDQDVCSEDADLILEMPDLIEAFIQSITKNASKRELNIDIELIPLKFFAASLKPS